MTFCEECKYLPNCELAKHEEVDTCKKGESMTDKQAKKEEKCKGCIWLYNGFCTCSGLKPCTKSKG